MRLFRRSLALSIVACSFLPFANAVAQEDVAARPSSPAPSAPALAPLAPLAPEPVVPREQLSPVVAEMLTALEEQRAILRGLRADLAAARTARDSRRALELENAMALAKQQTELRLLRIQADHARRAGRAEVAAGLDAAITAMSRAFEPPVSRPRPTPTVSR
jgi:hypothetical protein